MPLAFTARIAAIAERYEPATPRSQSSRRYASPPMSVTSLTSRRAI